MQEFWKEGTEWDALTSEEISNKVRIYIEDLKSLSDLKIPRRIFEWNLESLFGFCNASGKACYAIVYARYRRESEFCCRFICSKTRIAPMKALTILNSNCKPIRY